MTYQLKIKPYVPPTKEEIRKKQAPQWPTSPIGWWKVTTEGDEEGRTTQQLGDYYGHLAEIALHLADKTFSTLCFSPINDRGPGLRSELQATRDHVAVCFSLLESNTFSMSKAQRIKFVSDFLDTKDVVVEEECYWNSVRIRLTFANY